MKFAQQTCCPQSDTLNKRNVNNWSVLVTKTKPDIDTILCTLHLVIVITHKASNYHLQHEWQWRNNYFSVFPTDFYQLLLTVKNNLYILRHITIRKLNLFTIWFASLSSLVWMRIPSNPCACLLMTFLTFGNFWNPSSKRNNVPHNKTLILTCQYCKCWHLTNSWPVSTGFLILVTCTQCSSPKDEYTCFLLNQMLLGNLCFSFWLTEKDCNGKMFISMVHF
jgi:hypothetical protein